ncbi:DegT/DnrJ/EryC1/StrS family aminotransferase [Candidatus Roizmanbacteria bacterium]|jgi:UDP-2-acetamido-2-deoxy-ribo-hexuluronate aminotransferase|nr:DegT/DnrJ/EryC1/StrS family aminotransferase [Candidatus Roizmanbacteria bacterium]
MQFIDLAKQQSLIKDKLDERIQAVLSHGKYIMGPEVTELEDKLKTFVGTKHCLSCSSGTDALLIPLMAWGVGPGDAVLTTPFTFVATAEVVQLVGATPVFVDIDRETFNIDPQKLEEAIKQIISQGKLTPKVIIPVDLFGLPADYPQIEAIAKKYNLLVLEDAAQGFGGAIGNSKACSFGHAGATSFFPAKPLGCYGDGGALFTNDDNMIEIFQSIRVHGMGSDKYDNVRVGLNARLDTFQAAILLEKFACFPNEIELRNKVASWYTEKLKGKIETPIIPENYTSVWAQYSVVAESAQRRAELQQKLKEKGVPTAVYYPKPLHLQTAFKHLGYKSGDFPISEAISERIFSLPMHPYLCEEEVEHISKQF